VYKTSYKFVLNNKIQIQNIHDGFTSRLGGIVIFFYLCVYSFFFDKSLYLFICFSLLIVIPAFIEDLHFPVHPWIRFVMIIIASFLIISSMKTLPIVNISFLIFLNQPIIQILFYSFALATLINGFNFIDGVNGLCAFSSLIIFFTLFLIGMYLQDFQIMNISAFTIVLIISFIIFNYPFGKIFLGDTGSYLLGLLAGFIVIKLYTNYNFLPTWTAVTILFYPTFEVFFSYLRKIISKKSPFAPDSLHLHTQIYNFLLKDQKPNYKYNSLVLPRLVIFWISPLSAYFAIKFFPDKSWINIIFLTFIYLIYYFYFSKKQQFR